MASETDIEESELTKEILGKLAYKTSPELAELVDTLIISRIADAIETISDRIEGGLGVRP